MKNILLIFILIFISCKHPKKNVSFQRENAKEKVQMLDSILKSKHYVIGKKYEPLSLHYKGKPFQIIGNILDSLEKTDFIFNFDPNGDFDKFYGIVTDYFTMDENLQIKWSDIQFPPLMSGIAFFSAIHKRKEIFTLRASWLILTDVDDSTKPIIIDNVTKKIFPILKNKLKIENGWTYQIKSKDYVEKFEVTSPEYSNSHYWQLEYWVTIR